MTASAPSYSFSTRPTALLSASGVRGDWISCQRQPITQRASTDPAEWARRLFHDPPAWVGAALALRDRAVGLIGIRPTEPDSFAVLAGNDTEVIVGTDDRHLDFRTSVRCAHGSVDVITVVQIHNALGWLYLLPVRVMHPLMVRRMLRRTAALLDRGE